MRKLKNEVIFLLTVIISFGACIETTKQVQPVVTEPTALATKVQKDCGNEEKLLYAKDGFSSYTEDKIRGKGVISFELQVNDRLDIYDEDDAVFGYIVLNEDQTFFTAQMPKKLVARKVIPELDFAAFDFDAEEESASKDYLFIYANGEKKKVKKTDAKYSYQSWGVYLKKKSIALKPCNPLANAPNGGQNLVYDVKDMDDDQIKIKSSADCGGEESKFAPAQGWVKWRKKDLLMVDLKVCD